MLDQYQRGATVPLTHEVRTSTGVLSSATSVEASVWDPTGTLTLDGETLTEGATGVYAYNLATDSDNAVGCYRIHYKQVLSGVTSISVDYFTLMDSSVPPVGWSVITLADQLRAEMDQNSDAAGGIIPDRIAKIVREQGRWLFDQKDWLFRKAPATLTVAASATEVDMPSDFKELDTNTMRVSDTTNCRLLWTEDVSAWQEAKSLIGTDAASSYPRVAVLYRTAGAWKAKIWPAADQEYTYDFWYLKSSPWTGTSPSADNIALSPSYWTEDFDEGWYKLCAYHVLSRFRGDDAWKGFKSEFTSWMKDHDRENNETISVALEPVDDVMMGFRETARGTMDWLPGGTFKWYGST